MTWWVWVIIGIFLALVALLGYALCKAAGDADKRMGYK